MKNILLIQETNVDGCGGCATETILLDHEPTAGEVERLTRALSEVEKRVCENEEDFSTEDIVREALQKTFGDSGWVWAAPTVIEF